MAQTAKMQQHDQPQDCGQPAPGMGAFCWNELNVPDIKAAMKFYEDTLGWTFAKSELVKDDGHGSYWIASANGRMVAGVTDMGRRENPDMPPHWLGYIAVENIDARVAKAEKLGAKVMLPPSDIPMVGRIAILIEPAGAAIGWMTPAPQ